MARELLDQRFDGEGMPSGVVVQELWCSAMRKNRTGSDAPMGVSAVTEPVCGGLRVLFDEIAAEPIPDSLANLVDRLDGALERGELFAPKAKPSGR
jgi:hypothetical protein